MAEMVPEGPWELEGHEGHRESTELIEAAPASDAVWQGWEGDGEWARVSLMPNT